jgi:excisionase family DNA binding protein
MKFAFTVTEVANMTGLSPSQVRRMVNRGDLHKVRTEGSSVRIGLGSILACWPDAALVLTPQPSADDCDPHGIVRPDLRSAS